jgi:hypothetical protein
MPRSQHPLEVYRFNEMVEEGLEVHEMSARDLLIEILGELQQLNKQIQLITDEEEVIEDDYS